MAAVGVVEANPADAAACGVTRLVGTGMRLRLFDSSVKAFRSSERLVVIVG